MHVSGLMQLERKIHTIEVVAEIGAALVKARSLTEMLQECVQLLVKHLDAALARIWLLDEPTQVLQLRASAGMYTHLNGAHGRIEVGQFKIGKIAKERRPHLTNDLLRDPLVSNPEWARSENIVAFVGHPLLVGEKLVGVIAVFSRYEMSDTELKLLKAVSDIIATAAEHKIAGEELSRSQSDLAAFFDNPVVGLHSVDGSGRIVRINQTELQMLGYPRDEVLGKHISEFHADKDIAVDLMMRLSNNEVIRDYRARMICKDGSVKHVLIDSDAVMVDGKFAYTRCFTRDVTDSAIARGHLERARQLFRAVFDQTFQLIGVLSLEGILLDANQTALNANNCKLEDVLGRYLWETPLWPGNLQTKERLQRAVIAAARGEISRFEVAFTNSDGQELDIDYTIKPVRDDTGEVVLLIPEGRDITERKRAERELLEKEAHTRAIVDTAPDGIITISTSGLIESANAPMHQMFGFNTGELVGLSVAAIIESLADLGRKFSSNEYQMQGKGNCRWETEGRRKNGELVPVEVSLSELALSDSKVFIAIVVDITERLRSQRLQAELAAIVESCEDPIYGIDLNGNITAWNPAAQRLFGYSAAQAIGQSVSVLMTDERKREMGDILARVKAGEKIQNFETVRMSKDGQLIDVALTVSPTRDRQHNVTGISIFARDISLKKAAEKRVSEFYSMVSHELRTPLTSIRASLGLLEGGIAGDLPSDAVQLVQIARSESDRLIRLINDILDLRKIEAGKVELRLETVRTEELIKRVCDAMKGLADESGIAIECVNEYNAELRCDKDRIIQVLTNLCSNAVKYSPEKASVVVKVKEGERGFARFCVTDSGPGIREQDLPKLFGKFQQIDSSDARPKGGTGLGLAIVKAIVEQHAGAVGVDTKPGKGATFWFEIPLSLPEVAEPTTGNILVVEDDRKLSKVLDKLLSSTGFKVTSAASVKQAEAELKSAVPDAILLDISLPDGSGVDFMQKLWRQSHTASIPIVVLTGRADFEPEKNPLLIDWMTKPFEKTRLTRALRRAVRRHTGNALQVLLVEDDKATATVLKKLINSTGVDCRWAPDGRTALTMVRNSTPDMIVLDVGVPPPDGFDLVRMLREEGAGNVPLLVYTGRDLDSNEREQLTLGMTLHLIKSKVGQAEFLSSMKELLGENVVRKILSEK